MLYFVYFQPSQSLHTNNNRMKKLITLLLLCTCAFVQAQNNQTVRGKIVELEAQSPVVGAIVSIVSDTTRKLKTISNEEGDFKIPDVGIGKHTLKISAFGFNDKYLDIQVNSGKEIVLNIELEEKATEIETTEIIAFKRGEVNNDMATVSARTFNVEETERYAGSRGDPARMASNFAGVQGADDSRNDIVVRGNSPLGVIYRMEGIELPNPNHFAISGSMGGPVTILNNKILANSDFFTGAFPAEYGNSTSAVFDLKLRPGNNEKHEFSGQFGFLGTEFMAEGPLNKQKHSSYLAVYRYSTLALFKGLGISVGTDAIPRYQDLSFKFNLPGKKGGSWSIWALSGYSAIDIKISDQTEPSTEFYGEDDRDQYFSTGMGILGISYNKSLNEKTFLKLTLAGSYQVQRSNHDYIIRHIDSTTNTWVNDSIYPLMGYKFDYYRYQLAWSVNRKLNKNHVIKAGLLSDLTGINMIDSVLTTDHSRFINRWDAYEFGILLQPYVQWKWKPNDALTFNAGLHAQYFSVSNSISPVEPRLGLKYEINPKHSVQIGGGLHSQIQPLYVYYYHQVDDDGNYVFNEQGDYAQHNKQMDFTKSWHAVAGHEWSPGAAFRIKTEVYYQYLYNIPVTLEPSAFSLTNMGTGFERFFPDSLVNKGTGQNKGIEFTIEKFFNKKYFLLVTASLFDARYKGSDGVERNTDFNGKYAVNLLGGMEFKTGKKTSLSLGTKITTAGGRWYGIVDTTASDLYKEVIFQDEGYNTKQFKPYFRTDFKINFKINTRSITHEFALDLLNIFNTQNILNLTYSPDPTDPAADAFRENYQLGFLPLFYYRIDF